MPQEPPKPRQPSKPEIAIEVDRTVGGAIEQRRFDLPKRTATLTDLPKAQPPAPKPTLTAFPAPPQLPLEHQPTLKAPNPLQRKTVQRPAPPSAVAAARRTDPPAAPESPPTSIRVPADETRPQATRSVSPLPAPSQRPDQASIEALRRRAEAAELRAIEAEALAKAKDTVELADDSEPPRGASKRDVRRALIGVLSGLTALFAPIGLYIAMRTEAIKPKVDATATNAGINAEDVKAVATRVAATEQYERAKYDHDVCVEQQLRAAIARGADHDLTTLPPGGTDWVQQHQPYRTRTVADAPAYIAIKPCPEAPKRP